MRSERVAPGVTFATYNLDDPNRVYVLTVERACAGYDLDVGWAQGQRDFAQRMPTSAIAALYDKPSATDVVAAVNASFFDQPPEITGATASDGELLQQPDRRYETAIIRTDGTATIVARLEPESAALVDVDMAITGVGWLVRNGQPNTVNWEQYKFDEVRHPRTVLAWNDRCWFLMVVDGRSAESAGMTFAELARFLIDELHAEQALNLDGGGSATMVVDGAVRNVPSDGSERPVANALLLVREAAAQP
ncbi:MAG: phosphodiester glycosidase family protein [Planctomycetes bacterium]|nr:phosphodiester glycosidase family protein [Planctomycetota bacterium]